MECLFLKFLYERFPDQIKFDAMTSFYSFYISVRISNFFDLSITEEILVEMRIWCIKIGIVLVLHFNPCVEASAGGLQVPDSLYSPVAKSFGTCLKIENKNLTVKKKVNFMNSSENEGLSPTCIALSFDGFGSIS
jgi:hypothetical protein